MGTQIFVEKEAMESAGWSSEDVVVQNGWWDTTAYDNAGEDAEWVPPVIDRKWSHPEHGVIWGYATPDGGFYADSRFDGKNRREQENAGLLDLPHCFS